MTIQELNRELGNVDIYLLDQILKGRYEENAQILDAGCGEGRNLIYFLNNKYDVYGVDQNPDAIRMLHFILGSSYPFCDKKNFFVSQVESMEFENESFDLVISSAVLHFARDHTHFDSMFSEMIRVLRKGGQLFIRMTTDLGLDNGNPLDNKGRCALPDGSERYLITREKIERLLIDFGLKLIEPVKTVLVDNSRSMISLVIRKD